METKLILKQGLLLFIIILFFFLMLGCKKSFAFPEEKDFSLSVSSSSNQLNVGDKLVVNAIFKNLNNTDYKITAANVFSESNIIHTNLYNIDEDEIIYIGESMEVNLKAREEVSEEKEFTIEKHGKYKVISKVIFSIVAPGTKKMQRYTIESNEIYINVDKKEAG